MRDKNNYTRKSTHKNKSSEKRERKKSISSNNVQNFEVEEAQPSAKNRRVSRNSKINASSGPQDR